MRTSDVYVWNTLRTVLAENQWCSPSSAVSWGLILKISDYKEHSRCIWRLLVEAMNRIQQLVRLIRALNDQGAQIEAERICRKHFLVLGNLSVI